MSGLAVIVAIVQFLFATTWTAYVVYLPALAKIKYPGVTADIEFDKNGDLTKGLLTIFKVTNGKWEVVSK